MKRYLYLFFGLGFLACQNTPNEKKDVKLQESLDTNRHSSIDTTDYGRKEILVKADTLLLLVRDSNGKFGYQDSTGKWLIDPTFELAGNFSEKLAPVLSNGKWQLINKKGKPVMELKKMKPIVLYHELSGEESIMPISEKALPVEFPDGKKGFLKLFNGKLTEKFDDVQPFSNGRAAILKGEKWGFITIDGKYLVKPIYDYARSFTEHRAIVSIGGMAGVIDDNGQVITPLKFKNAFPYKQGICFVTESSEYNQYYMIDLNGKEISKERYDAVYGLGFENGECEVRKAGKCIVIDKLGKKLRDNKNGCQEGC